ncbi:MAG: PQQ-like beta-propeller repeat protein [Planctomycetota bacterium]|nr:PQQ-like beta-propeller repeat protein [Planctomycetota bacterium]MDA1177908.1 PQQ-like beta-propeller repeat protein [Planctomycetota bacterium]
MISVIARVAILLVSIAATPLSATAADLSAAWPQWRGPTRDGQSSLTPAWPERFDDTTMTQQWRVELGPSYSGPIVAQDRVFVTETRDQQTEVVQALSRTNGKVLWSAEWPGALSVPFFARSNGDWIRATPAYDGESLFVAGMRDVLVCLDAQNGNERWRVDCAERFNSTLPNFGFVSSPLVDGEHVYVQAGASFLKLKKQTGETVWRVLEDDGGMNGSAFSSPIKATIAGVSQLLVQTRDRLAGVDEVTGSVLWSQTIEAFRGMNILTPVVIDDAIFTSSYGGKSWLFDVVTSGEATDKNWAVTQRWQNKNQGYMSTPVVMEGHIYTHLKNQRFACIEIATGRECWVTKPFGKYWSLVAQGQKILALDEKGDLLLINANPEKFELLSQHHVSDSPAWAHLAVGGTEIFVRDLTGLTVYRWAESTK